MKYSLAVFDLDGTILDTLDDLADSTNFALAKNSLPPRTRDEVRRFVGNGIRLLIERAVPENSPESVIDTVFADFNSHYKIHCKDKTKPYIGITNLLSNLRESGCRVAVVSNKADYGVQELCARYFPGMFDIAVGEKSGVRKKPAPDSVNAVLSSLCVNRTDAVYIGDSDVDIETANNAGLNCISVLWGFRSREFLLAHGAKNLISNPDEIEKLILG